MSAGVIIPDSSVVLKYHVDKLAKTFISKASLKTNKQKFCSLDVVGICD